MLESAGTLYGTLRIISFTVRYFGKLVCSVMLTPLALYILRLLGIVFELSSCISCGSFVVKLFLLVVFSISSSRGCLDELDVQLKVVSFEEIREVVRLRLNLT